jgi:hypothetical protein
MKPISFKEQNVVIAKDQPEYIPLPAFKFDTPEGHIVFCESLSIIERLRILFTGKIWGCFLTFNKPVTPSFFSTKKSDLISTNKK